MTKMTATIDEKEAIQNSVAQTTIPEKDLSRLLRGRSSCARNLLRENDTEMFKMKFEIWNEFNEQICKLLNLK